MTAEEDKAELDYFLLYATNSEETTTHNILTILAAIAEKKKDPEYLEAYDSLNNGILGV